MCVCGLLQLFDIDNHVNRQAVNYIFSTEGHLFPVSAFLRRAAGPRRTDVKHSRRKNSETTETEDTKHDENRVVFTLSRLYNLSSNVSPSLLLTVLIIIVSVN